MSGFLKWIGGGLGWAFGGPIGAVIGFTIGSLADKSAESVIQSVQGDNTTSSSSSSTFSRTTEGDFKLSLLVLMACVMKADGNAKKSELNVVKRFLVQNFGEEGALEGLAIVKQLLNQRINEVEIARQVNRHMNYSGKLELLHLLFEIAYADGVMTSQEYRLLQVIASCFGISTADFDSLNAPYNKGKDTNWAYTALEIQPNATNDEIKKAYRRMAMKFHPDKVNDLGEDVKKSATEKFRTINEAYEELKKQRGFN